MKLWWDVGIEPSDGSGTLFFSLAVMIPMIAKIEMETLAESKRA